MVGSLEEVKPSLGEGNALVTGVDTLSDDPIGGTLGGEETCEDAELPIGGAIELSVEATGVEDGGAIHFVQIVETTVWTIVDTVKELSTISSVPEVIVLVTGQVVRVV